MPGWRRVMGLFLTSSESVLVQTHHSLSYLWSCAEHVLETSHTLEIPFPPSDKTRGGLMITGIKTHSGPNSRIVRIMIVATPGERERERKKKIQWQWRKLKGEKTEPVLRGHVMPIVPLTYTYWACLPLFFILFLCLFALSTVFHSTNSLDNSPFSHSVLPIFISILWILSTILYLFVSLLQPQPCCNR